MQHWHYLPFEVSPSKKLTSTFANFFPTSSDILPESFHHPIHITSSLCICLATPLLLKFLSSIIFNFSYLLTSAFTLSLNSATASFAFSKSSSLSQLLCSSAVNYIYCTKYFTTPLTFLLFNIFSIFHSLTPSTSTSFTSSIFYSFICSLYHTIWLTFTTGWILIKVGSYSLTAWIDTTFWIRYGPTYWSTSFFASLSLNTKSFILSTTLLPFFYSSISLLPLSTCCFISFYTFLNTTLTFSCIFFILFTNSVIFSTFSFLLIFIPILNSLP